MPVIRRADIGDLDAVAAIQASSPQAAHWRVDEYMQYEFSVAIEEGKIAGFLVWRDLADGECEVLNLAVAPEFRRRGIGRGLIERLTTGSCRQIFLEVRESNQAARFFYKSMGFQEVNTRQKYYDSPLESAIVMKFHSC